jgi:hypothetical protein
MEQNWSQFINLYSKGINHEIKLAIIKVINMVLERKPGTDTI